MRNGHCPHYFIKKNNLFETKVQGESNQKLENVLLNILEKGLMYCVKQCDKVYELYVSPEAKWKYDDNFAHADLSDQLHACIAIERKHMLIKVDSPNLSSAISKHEYLERCNKKVMKTMTTGDRKLYRIMLRGLYTSLGSHLLAQAFETQDQPTKDALLAKSLYHLERGKKFDSISARLKLETFYYMIGDYMYISRQLTLEPKAVLR